MHFQIINSLNFINILIIALVAILSFALCFLSFKLLNKIPAKWLCDYDEEPDETILSNNRFPLNLGGVLIAFVFVIASVLCLLSWGVTLQSLFVFLITYIMFLVALCDFKFTIIPDQFVAVLGGLSLALALFDLFGNKIFISDWWQIPLGALCGGGVLFLINILSVLIFKKEGMGFGDVKLMACLGMCLGFPMVFITLLIAILLAFVYIIILVIKNLIQKKQEMDYFPFGPFLCGASFCTLVFIDLINCGINSYLSLFTF